MTFCIGFLLIQNDETIKARKLHGDMFSSV